MARYYLVNCLADKHSDPLLDTRIDRVYQQANGGLPNRDGLGNMIFPGGVTLARLGADHMGMNDHIDVATIALAMTVIEWLKYHDQIVQTPGSEDSGTSH